MIRQTYLEINLNNFKDNINEIKKLKPNKTLIPVIKANGYGTYINKRLDIINEFNIVAVAIVEEAIELRKLGYKKDILVLNQPFTEEIEDIIKYNITPGISSIEFLKELIKTNKEVKIHIELETGMNRTGFQNIEEVIKLLKENTKIIVEGIYTHFSSADDDDAYTKKQINKFKDFYEILSKEFNTIKYIHTSASNGLVNYDIDFTNTIRPGIIMYGYPSYQEIKNKINLKPIAKLVSKISYLKEIDKNESVSYNQTYKTTKKTKVATIPLGYADGLKRSLSNKGNVVIENKLCPIIGNVCMDSILVDVTDINDIKIGDKVYIFDNVLITLEDIAKQCNTINYEILRNISERVPRIYIPE
jgi:alanine racemase